MRSCAGLLGTYTNRDIDLLERPRKDGEYVNPGKWAMMKEEAKQKRRLNKQAVFLREEV